MEAAVERRGSSLLAEVRWRADVSGAARREELGFRLRIFGEEGKYIGRGS